MGSSIDPIIAFARKLRPYLDGIFAHARWSLLNSVVEGINKRIKFIKRIAYGSRD